LLTSIEKVPGFGRTFVGLYTPLDSSSAPEFYLPCASEMAVGDVIYGTSSEDFVTSSKKGFVSSIAQMPQNGYAFNVELSPGQGGKVARSAGSRVTLQGEDLSSTSKDGFKSFVIKLPSGATSTVSGGCLGQTGFNSNEAHYYAALGKAGRNRLLGRRPKVRGVAMNPVDHPMGGGEGKASGGRPSVSPQGWQTKGRRTVRRK
jgi:large subunit ribosomal protein L2